MVPAAKVDEGKEMVIDATRSFCSLLACLLVVAGVCNLYPAIL